MRLMIVRRSLRICLYLETRSRDKESTSSLEKMSRSKQMRRVRSPLELQGMLIISEVSRIQLTILSHGAYQVDTHVHRGSQNSDFENVLKSLKKAASAS